MNANKTDFMCFKRETVSSLSDNALKIVDKLTYLGCKILSTENDVNIRLTKACTAILT